MMKKFYLAAATLVLTFCIGSVKAQEFPVPAAYELSAKTDYAKYEQDIVKTADWLQQTPWSEQIDKRKEANTFVFRWLEGSPDVNIMITPALMTLCKKNQDLLTSYMAGFAKYAILHKADYNGTQANAAAIRTMLAKYQMQTDHVTDKTSKA